MKKVAYSVLFIAAVALSACNASTSKTGGDVADSGANHDNSGPADSVGVVTPGDPGSGLRTDTSTIGSKQDAPNPSIDTSQRRPQ